MEPRNIVLVGFMGTGKTSVGKILAKKLNRSIVDVDEAIEASEKRKIRDIFKEDGEAHFRVLEKKAIQEIAQRRGLVITTGGGAVLDVQNIEVLKETGFLVALWASPETILKRVAHSKNRPLLKEEDRLVQIQRLLAARKPFYEKADFYFKTDGLTAEEVAKNILEKLEGELS